MTLRSVALAGFTAAARMRRICQLRLMSNIREHLSQRRVFVSAPKFGDELSDL